MNLNNLISGIKNNKKIVLIIFCTFIFTTLILTSDLYVVIKSNYEVGQVSNEKIKSPRTIVNTPETEKLKEEAYNGVQDYYKIDNDITNSVIEDINEYFDLLESERIKYLNKLSLEYTQRKVDTEVLHEEASESYEIDNEELLQILSNEEMIFLFNLDNKQLVEFKTFVMDTINEALKRGIKNDSILNSFLLIDDYIKTQSREEEISSIAYKIIINFLRPNLVVDEEATEKAREEAVNNIEPIYYLEGQTIIDEGEVITEDIYSVLQELGYTNKETKDLILSYISIILINFILTGFYLSYIYVFNKKYFFDKGIIGLISTIHILFVLLSFALSDTWIKVLPLYVAVYLLTFYLGRRITSAIAIVLIATMSNFIAVTSGEVIFLILTANIEILFTKEFKDRSSIILGSIILSFAFGLIHILICIIMSYNNLTFINETYSVVVTTFVSIIFAYGVSPIFATLFDISTNSRLLEFTKPDATLIRRLTLEASGTYQHSLVVANLSEEAAIAIGADSVLCRVASYYHDIGKLENPIYFGENQNGYNPHNDISPIESARIILNHTIYGIELAQKHKLPKKVIDIIPQHHGTTKVAYFYDKALKDDNLKDKVTEDMFVYNGLIPQSKEAGIIMLADTAEAAVRSIAHKTNSFEEIDGFIKNLIKGKIDSNQLIDSGLTFKDIEIIRQSFMKIFKSMYHNRVEYPEKERETDEKQ